MNEGAKEEWEERAAILEFDAGMARKEAEKMALLMVSVPGLEYEKYKEMLLMTYQPTQHERKNKR